jgi:hypothetical protein
MDHPVYSTPQNPWYRPGGGYNSKIKWRDTPFVKQQLDPQIPEGVYTSFLGDNKLGGTDAESTWAQNLYGKTLAGYKAALRANPSMMYKDYLNKQFNRQTLQNQYLSQTARSRGENPTAFSGATRMIGWG